jgi:hypothetical protein
MGPFVVHFCNGIVRIHAPFCLDHHANILSDNNDISLYGLLAPPPSDGYTTGFTYELSGPDKTGPRSPDRKSNYSLPDVCADLDKLLVVNKTQGAIDAKKTHLLLKAPRPDIIIPLQNEQIWIHRRDAKTWVNTIVTKGEQADIVDEKRARGLRFIYSACDIKPTLKLVEFPKLPPEQDESVINTEFGHLDPCALGYEPSQNHLLLRFTSNSSAPDAYHEDAYDCFHEMRKLIPEAPKWRVDFDELAKDNNQPTTKHHGGSIPVDCGAMVLAVPEFV